MKLNHRDRVLITVVFVAAVWIIGVWFFIVPAFQELGDKRDELNKQQIELSNKKDQIEKDKDLPQRIEQEYAKSEELAKNFYTYQTTQNATDTVDQLLDDQKITNSTMQISEYTIKTLKPFYYVSKLKTTDFDTKVDQYENVGNSSNSDSSKAAAKPKVNSKTTNDGAQFTVDPNAGIPIGSYEIELQFTGVYSDVQKFCEQLTKNVPGSMVLTGLEIIDVNGIEKKDDSSDSSSSSSSEPEKKEDGTEKTIDDNEVEGTIRINIMIIKKLTKPEF